MTGNQVLVTNTPQYKFTKYLQSLIKPSNLVLVHFGSLQRLLHRIQRRPEQIPAQFLEPGPCDGRVKVLSLEQRVDLDGGLGGGGDCPLGALAGGAETAERPLVARDVLLVLSLELLDEVVHQPVVEILTLHEN